MPPFKTNKRVLNMTSNQQTQPTASFFAKALLRVLEDATHRCYIVIGVALSFSTATAAPTAVPGYPHLNSSTPTYNDFTLNTSDSLTVLADSTYFIDRSIGFDQWRDRARKIRDAGSPIYCSGNLSIALTQVGAAHQASASGSTTLLTLLPTAGALIGAPAKELWVLYKLVPLAGFLSSVLSLGGSIVPHQVSDYTSLEDFSYSGMPTNNAVDGLMKRRPSGRTWTDSSEPEPQLIAEHFADQVYARAMDSRGSSKLMKISLGILGLSACVLLICGACYMLSAGSIVVWWCTVSTDFTCKKARLTQTGRQLGVHLV